MVQYIRDLLRIVESNIENFDILRDAERACLKDDLRILNAKCLHDSEPTFTMAQAISVRNLITIIMNITARRHRPNLEDYFQTYMHLKDNNHEEIIRRASRIYHMPPRYILDEYTKFQFPQHSVREIISGAIPSDLTAAIAWANEHDAESPQNKLQEVRDGELFERLLEQHLRAAGCNFRTQSEVAAEQVAGPQKRAYATPDILFTEPIEITIGSVTHTIHWMDAKNFMYVPLVPSREYLASIETHRYQPSYIDIKLAEQATRYQEHFGNGAFVFAYGYMRSHGPSGLYSQHLQIGAGHCLLLSGEHIRDAESAAASIPTTYKKQPRRRQKPAK